VKSEKAMPWLCRLSGEIKSRSSEIASPEIVRSYLPLRPPTIANLFFLRTIASGTISNSPINSPVTNSSSLFSKTPHFLAAVVLTNQSYFDQTLLLQGRHNITNLSGSEFRIPASHAGRSWSNGGTTKI